MPSLGEAGSNMIETNWTLEWLKIAQGLLGTLVGGGLVLFGGWLADRRKNNTEEFLKKSRERALLTGMFAVRNYVMQRVNEWSESGLLSHLEPLRTSQAYVHRLIDKAPGESESLMIVAIGIGLHLDAVLATIDRRLSDPALRDPIQLAETVTRLIEELVASIEQFDLITGSELTILTDEDLAKFPGFAEAQDEATNTQSPQDTLAAPPQAPASRRRG